MKKPGKNNCAFQKIKIDETNGKGNCYSMISPPLGCEQTHISANQTIKIK